MIKLKKIIETIEQDKYYIFVDLDGVICDFDKQFNAISGSPYKTGYEYKNKHGIKAFWNIVNKAGLNFWALMPWMRDGKRLWKYITTADSNATILSALPKTNTNISLQGKKMWVKRNLGTKTDFIFVSDKTKKKEYARSKSILIDDQKQNIVEWKAAGGIGIVFKSTNQTISELRKYRL